MNKFYVLKQGNEYHIIGMPADQVASMDDFDLYKYHAGPFDTYEQAEATIPAHELEREPGK